MERDQAQRIYDEALRLYRAAAYTIESGNRRGLGRMSKALWCDPGSHAFSDRDPGRQHISRTLINSEGDEVTEPWDICGPHAAESSLFRTAQPAIGGTDGPQDSRL